MEEIRSIALAYYRNLPEELKIQALNLFKQFDSDGDGAINLKEFLALMNCDPEWSLFYKKVFSDLDKSGDGELDYEEFLSFFYILLSGRGFLQCDGCRGYLNSVYFTCTQCFSNYPNSFDLCLPCYRAKNYTHTHAEFLDNYTILLKIQKEVSTDDSSTDGGCQSEQGRSSQSRSINLHSSEKALKTVEKCATAIGEFTAALSNSGEFTETLSNVGDFVDAVATVCTIM